MKGLIFFITFLYMYQGQFEVDADFRNFEECFARRIDRVVASKKTVGEGKFYAWQQALGPICKPFLYNDDTTVMALEECFYTKFQPVLKAVKVAKGLRRYVVEALADSIQTVCDEYLENFQWDALDAASYGNTVPKVQWFLSCLLGESDSINEELSNEDDLSSFGSKLFPKCLKFNKDKYGDDESLLRCAYDQTDDMAKWVKETKDDKFVKPNQRGSRLANLMSIRCMNMRKKEMNVDQLLVRLAALAAEE